MSDDCEIIGMQRHKIILVGFVLVVAVAIAALSLFVFFEEKRVTESPEEAMRKEVLEITAEIWQNPEQPMQSLPMRESEIPKEAVKIGVTSKGFSPATFEVRRGQKVMLALTNRNEWIHIVRFKDEALSNVGVGVKSGEAKVITFYAPSEPGEYEFSCVMWGHEEKGEKGKMIVE